MTSFAITFLCIDGDLASADCFCRQVDWPSVPRCGDSIEIIRNGQIRKVESVCYDDLGFPTVYLGPVMIDEEEACRLLEAGWRPISCLSKHEGP